MAHVTVRDLPALINSSGSSVVTSGVGNLDDASSITIYLSTATNILSSNVSIEIAQFDIGTYISTAVSGPVVMPTGVTWSTNWYPMYFGTSLLLTSGAQAFTVTPVAFRSIRLRTSANAITTGTTIAYLTKQISV